MKIAFVGLAGVPSSRRAADARIMAHAIAFVKLGHTSIIYNKFNLNKKLENVQDFLEMPNIQYHIIFNKTSRNKFEGILLQFFSYLKELIIIPIHNKKNKIEILHVYSGHIVEIFYYFLLAKMIRAKVVYQYVEFTSGYDPKNAYYKINDYLINNYVHFFIDGAIVISNFIKDYLLSRSKTTLILKIPPICDFDHFDKIKSKNGIGNYFLFSGSADYFEIIKFIIDSSRQSKIINAGYKLVLVVNGSEPSINKILKYINGDNYIFILTKLSYSTLICYYKNAKGLLIPLNNCIKDITRFPNKICEYSASKSVIITTSNGEIAYYFKDRINALIANNFNELEFAKLLDWAIENDSLLSNIANNSYNLGRNYLDINSYSNDLNNFLLQILSNQAKKQH